MREFSLLSVAEEPFFGVMCPFITFFMMQAAHGLVRSDERITRNWTNLKFCPGRLVAFIRML